MNSASPPPRASAGKLLGLHAAASFGDGSPERPSAICTETYSSSRRGLEHPQLFMALHCDAPLEPPTCYPLADLEAVVIGSGQSRSSRKIEVGTPAMHVQQPDRYMSRDHAHLRKIVSRWVVEDNHSENGTYVNGVRVKQATLRDGDVLELGHTFFVYRDKRPRAEDEKDLENEHTDLSAIPGLRTVEPQLALDFQRVARVARSGVSVIILGESGTGKEVVARAIHALSGRTGEFVGINCGALPETLIEAELFGHRKGAFSGANEDHIGLIRSADRGTFFLDEIGDLPLSAQAKFLRVLQERQVVPLGATKPIDVDIRLCAATHRSVDRLLAANQFREDLFARISGMSLQLPPLRKRREDLGLLIAAMLRRFAPERADRITLKRAAARAIFCYGWPLNVRELEKCLEAATVLAQDNVIRPEILAPQVRAVLPVSDSKGPSAAPEKDAPEELKRRDELVRLLAEHKGNISQVARVMNKARLQIRRWLQRYQIDIKKFRTP